MSCSAFLKYCGQLQQVHADIPTVIGAPHGLDMTTLIVKIMNTLLHTQPGNLTKEVGLLHIILLPMIVQCQGQADITVNKLDMVAAYAGHSSLHT